MTINQLQYFIVTAQELHFGRAARILHIAQPSLSCAMANLEEEIGLPLFEKHGKNISLSAAGRLLQKQASRILEQIASTQRQLSLLKEEADTSVSLAYTSTMLAAGLPKILGRFVQNHGEHFQISTDEVPTPDAIQGIKDGKYDLALCMKVSGEPEILQTPIFKAPHILIVPKDNPLTDEVTLEEAAQYPLVIYRACLARAFVEQLFHEAGLHPNFRHFTYSVDAAMHLVGSGLGISFVDDLPYLERDLVRVLSPAWLTPHTHDMYLTRSINSNSGKAVQILEEYLLSQSYPQ